MAGRKGRHVHRWVYYGGQAKCNCGKYLQPDGRITATPTTRTRAASKKRKKAAKPRQNPVRKDVAARGRGEAGCLKKARALSRQFHGDDTEVLELTPAERKPLPRYVVLAGKLVDFTYQADSTSPKRKGLPWRHVSGDRGPLQPKANQTPLLVVDPETKRAAIVHGRSPMRLTGRGFSG